MNYLKCIISVLIFLSLISADTPVNRNIISWTSNDLIAFSEPEDLYDYNFTWQKNYKNANITVTDFNGFEFMTFAISDGKFSQITYKILSNEDTISGSYNFNADGKISDFFGSTIQTWSSIGEDPVKIITPYKYHIDYNSTLTYRETIYYMNPTDSSWIKDRKNEFSYDSLDILTTVDNFYWDTTSSDWRKQGYSTLQYNNSGFLEIEKEVIKESSNSDWTNYRKKSYSYNSSNFIEKETTASWSDIDSVWNDNYSTEYEYNLTGKLSKIFESDIYNYQQSLSVSYKEKYSYNDAENIIEALEYYWNEDASVFSNTNKTIIIYDSIGNLKSVTKYNWNDSLSDFIINNKRSFVLTWNGVEKTELLKKDKIIIPLNFWLNNNRIHFSIPKTQNNTKISIYNSLGRNVYNAPVHDINGYVNIDISDLCNGTFFIKIDLDGSVYSRQFILLK